MEFPVLYKKSESGSVITWEIWTEGEYICTEYGVIGGSVQQSRSSAKEGTNIGRSNERSPEEQAEFEAEALWKKKLDKDMYSESPDDLDVRVKVLGNGGIKPMKCQKYGDKYPSYPCYIQPKLNGLRCIAVKDNGVVSLWFSGGKQITTMQHIVDELTKVMPDGDLWDGELYKHTMPLNDINGIVKANVNPHPESVRRLIEYHVFDRIPAYVHDGNWNLGFYMRFTSEPIHSIAYVKEVPTYIINGQVAADDMYEQFVNEGYEGAIYRQMEMQYLQKRSKDILKRKDFKEEEFKIVGYTEGEGKLEGCIASFLCECKGGTVDVPMNGTQEYLRWLMEDHSRWKGKYVQTRFLEYSEYGKPQIPRGLNLREKVGLD